MTKAPIVDLTNIMPSKKIKTKHKVPTLNNNEKVGALSPTEAFHQAFYTDTESSDDDNSNCRGSITRRGRLKKQRGRRPKRPKTAIPESSPISDIDQIIDEVEDSEEGLVSNDHVPVKIIQGLSGPQLEIDLAKIIADSRVSIKCSNVQKHLSVRLPKKSLAGLRERRASFTDLPPELSVEIYRKVFVTQNEPIVFTDRKSFQRSGQLLRTCRKIYEEGSIILYGANAFHFARTHAVRGTYFDAIWKDVGYKDVRRFFRDIGPQNIAKLKYVSFEFEDALPTFTPRHTQEERKYVNDAILLEVLRMLAKHTTLEKFGVGFRGKSNLNEKDYHFLKVLTRVRCFEISSDAHHCLQRVEYDTYNRLKGLVEIMVNKGTDVDKTKNKFAPRMFTAYGRRYVLT